MSSEQKRYEFFVMEIVKNRGQKGKERIKPTDPQAKAVIEKYKKCAICSISYTDKLDIFDIHHIDGRSDNTYTKNLALICSNCHRQVHTEAKRILKDVEKGDPYPIRPLIKSTTRLKGDTRSSNNFISVKCVICSGTGRDDPFMGSVCPVCKGLGEYKIKKSAKKCAFCKGTGIENPILGTICHLCNGKGYR